MDKVLVWILTVTFSALAIPILQGLGTSSNRGATIAEVQTDTHLPEGLVPLRSVDGRWGYVDRNQTYVIKPQFEMAKRFSEGLAPAALGKKFGYIDSTGRFVIQPQFVFAEPFSEGLALVFPDWGINFLGHQEGYTLFVRAGYIDRTGKMVIRSRFAENAHNFSGGLAAFKPGINYTYGQSKWGYLDKTGNWAIQPQFDIAEDFSEDLAAVCVRIYGPYRDQWGYIDKLGKFVIPPQYEKAQPFSRGLAKVKTSDGWHHVDKQGKFARTDSLPHPTAPHLKEPTHTEQNRYSVFRRAALRHRQSQRSLDLPPVQWPDAGHRKAYGY